VNQVMTPFLSATIWEAISVHNNSFIVGKKCAFSYGNMKDYLLGGQPIT
jgi:hypothetical protein